MEVEMRVTAKARVLVPGYEAHMPVGLKKKVVV